MFVIKMILFLFLEKPLFIWPFTKSIVNIKFIYPQALQYTICLEKNYFVMFFFKFFELQKFLGL